MTEDTDTDTVSEAFAEKLVRTCRTTVGDRLRSVTYFDAAEEQQLYLRDDLEAEADLVGFADSERLGFRSKSVYSGSELGAYRFTMRAFERGYLTRVIANGHGVFVTTDKMTRDRFEELASALQAALEEHAP